MSSWLVVTGVAVATGGMQQADVRYPIQEFPTYAACSERLRENATTGIYDAHLLQQMFGLASHLQRVGKHPAVMSIRLHCEQ